MPVADGRLLHDGPDGARDHSLRFVHAHRWHAGDLVIWDNRCTMHRARPFDTTRVRDLRRVTTRDVASTLEQAA
jgi:alpha-ketoglutarate-dependent 2,4-dichlorophenoxyacetate dioxygenase